MIAVALILATLTQSPPAASPQRLVTRAVRAIGGDTALRELRTLSVEFYTTTYSIGQEEWPHGPPRANLAIGRTLTDYAGERQTASIELRGPGGVTTRLRRVTAGQIGMLETNGRQGADNPNTVASAVRNLRRAPERILLAALDNPAVLRALPPRAWRGDTHDGVRYASGPDTVDIFFDRRTGLPIFTYTVTDDPILGDRRTTTALTRWQDAGGGLLYPRQLDIEVNGRAQTHSVFTAVSINPALDDSLFAIPDSIRERAQPAHAGPAPVTVSLVELAPNVWRAEGGSHHSLIVDQGTRLVIVEAPQSRARMEAVLDTIRSRFRGKSIGFVVNTHHHWDHAGGVRTAMAAGIPVATQLRNVNFMENIAIALHTVEPDAISRTDRNSTITAVRDSFVIGSGPGQVVVYLLPTTHVSGMLVAYLPAARLLFQSDVLSPGANLAAWGSSEIVRFVRARGLAVDRVVGGHGGVAAWADVERAAQGVP